MKVYLFFLLTLFSAAITQAASLSQVQTVFIILMENANWADIKGSTDAPYLNNTLLPMASHCEEYYNPPTLHPSLPNYLWLESGTNFGVTDDNSPATHHQSTTNHFTTLLRNAGISWRTYQEDIIAGYVPLANTNKYAVKHNPFAYFDDVTGTNSPSYAYGIAHIRPYTELAADLTNNTVARYNFITPNLIHDGHDVGPPENNQVKQIDDWLSTEIPKLLASAAYSNNGAIFITWDEGEDAGAPDGPIGMIVLSPLARGGGYFNRIHYTHSSTLRTFEEIFGVTPLLRDAAKATDLSDLFTSFAITQAKPAANGAFQLTVNGVVPSRTNYIEASTNFTAWNVVSTNVSTTNYFSTQDNVATNYPMRFYRAREVR